MNDRALVYFPENALERILARAATDPSARPDFYRMLLESDVFFMIPRVTQEGVHVAREGEQGQLITLSTERGPVIPMFTAVSRILQIAGPSQAYLGMRGQAAFEMLAGPGHAAVLNPGFSSGKELVPQEIQALADGSLFAAEPRGRIVPGPATPSVAG